MHELPSNSLDVGSIAAILIALCVQRTASSQNRIPFCVQTLMSFHFGNHRLD